MHTIRIKLESYKAACEFKWHIVPFARNPGYASLFICGLLNLQSTVIGRLTVKWVIQ